MFFLLVSLPKNSFEVLEEILEKYESGGLVKLPKAKLNSKMGKEDCKYVVLYIVLSLAISTSYMCSYTHVCTPKTSCALCNS